jgi:hypothetical protein
LAERLRRLASVAHPAVSLSAMTRQGFYCNCFKSAKNLVTNRISGFYEFQGERERGKPSIFKGLGKAFVGADSKILKMRRFAAYKISPR